jgi:hypothetical protein
VAAYFLRPGRPQDIAAVAERHPELRIACNHLALGGGGRGPEALAAHVDLLKVLLPHGNVVITISSLWGSSGQEYPYADIHDSVRRIYDLFGASRLAWATDYTAARGRLGGAVTYPMLRGSGTHRERRSGFLVARVGYDADRRGSGAGDG